VFIFLLQCTLCLTASLYNTLWVRNNQDGTNGYLDLMHIPGASVDWSFGYLMKTIAMGFGTWILLFTNMVPISLLVTMELVKFWQAEFIMWDYNIFCEEKEMNTKVQSSNLNEELGQINYVFSDKTGTLTQNIMEFKMMSMGGKSYGTKSEVTDDEKV